MVPQWKRLSLAVRALLLPAAACVLACGELRSPTAPGNGMPPDPSASFTRVQNEIFTPSCAHVGCHGAIGTQEGLLLAQGSAYAAIVGVPSREMPALVRVAPNDPANSYLYRKVTGAGITGERMPFGAPPLSDAQIALLRDWILRGAPND